jgi:hypothetical protein
VIEPLVREAKRRLVQLAGVHSLLIKMPTRRRESTKLAYFPCSAFRGLSHTSSAQSKIHTVEERVCNTVTLPDCRWLFCNIIESSNRVLFSLQ